MNIRHMLGAAAGVALLAVLAPATASAAVVPDEVTVDRIGRLARDGELTLSGTYRCEARHGRVFIGSTVRQRGWWTEGIGGTRAHCDGRAHRWANRAHPFRDYLPGRARVRVSLVRLGDDGSWLPLPHLLAERNEVIRLRLDGRR